MTPPRAVGARIGRALISTILVALLAAGCVPTGERPELVDEHLSDEADGAPEVACLPAGDQFADFAVAPITVRTDAGALARCVLVADTPELRQQGLSGVPDLGGHTGMIFAFADDTSGSFWMGNTHVPLTIAFIDGNGVVVSVQDMEPCPEAGPDCESYFPDAPYRWALEVPQGQLAAFGLGEGATLDPTSLPVAVG